MTKKISKKAIKAEVTKEVARQYENKYGQKIECLKTNFDKSCQETRELRKENERLKSENIQLTDKLKQYEDWIERLQEWLNLPDDERNKAINEFKTSQMFNCQFNKITQMIGPYMSMLFK